ncbi:hypothetical protein DW1_2188 [Proteiniborus sp. DW1]|nr:hypothetical protein DW1_2188 [Proteiniborus sp. DW1]
MKTQKTFLTKAIKVFCSFLVMLAPIALSQTACWFLWGEPDCPECLKQEVSS